MASLQPDDAVRYLARLGAGRAALLALVLAAACGGERNRSAAGDTTGAAVTPDSAAMPVTDTSRPAAADSARSASPTSDTGKTTAAAPATKPAAPPTKPATKPAATAPSATAARPATPADTGSQVAGKQMAAADSTTKSDSPKAPAAPAAPSPAQDTSSKPTATADAPLRDEYHRAPHDTVSQSVYDGWKQFNLNCARCHGEDALGTTIAPHLILSLKPDGPINTKELFMQTVCAGRPAKGMPAWCALGLGMDKISNIYEYVKGRSDAKISPGRPAVKQQG